MSQEQINQLNLQGALDSCEHHIDFLRGLRGHITGKDDQQKIKSMAAMYCLHRYINDKLISETEEMLKSWKKEQA